MADNDINAPLQSAMITSVVLLFIHFVATVKAASPANFKQDPTYKPVEEQASFPVWTRVHANQYESIPFQLIVIWGSIACGGHPVVLMYTIYAYLAFRVLFFVLYVHGLQPWRSLCFVGSMLCSITCGVLGCLGVFGVFPEK
eukprot:TRINITY_DN10666_c0_g3_i1.p1 TRINITY_DN10666_c0_g3~~TRINITY_DN10666_c0_g3_i1.p1  ORF type:complete len:164 (+),score=28.23 TRINITY_DN10666_c0_g3_i1:67-492(+)